MKKGLILTTALALALGVGAAVGAHQAKVREVKADGTTLYCKMTYDWWTTGGAAIGAHYWGGTDGTSWPGVRMTKVSGDNGVWKIAVPSGHTGIIFTRMNPSDEGNQDWGAKTGDLTIPTDGKNLYTITSESAVWGDPGVTGAWSTYVEPAPDVPADDGYYIVGTKSNWKFAGATKMNAGDDQNNAILLRYQASEGEEFKARSYLEGVDAWYGVGQENSNYVSDADKEVNIYLSKDGHLYVSNYVEPDVPAEDGYYIVGTKSNWKFDGATKMDAGQNGNRAQLLQYSAAANEEFKVHSYLEGADAWYGVGEGYANNFEVGENARTLNIYINGEGHLYVEDYVEPDFPAEDGYYIVGTKSNWKFDGATKMGAGDDQNDAILLRYSASEGEEFKARSYFEGVSNWYGVGQENSNYVSDADKEVNIYLSKDGHIYVSDYVEPDIPDEEGYYIKGSEIGWRYDTAIKMTNVDNGNVAEYYDLSVDVGDEIRVCSYYTDRDPYNQWADVGDNFDPDDPESIGYKEGDNFKFKIAGSYDIYAKYEDKDEDGNNEFYFYVAAHVERVRITLTAKKYAGKQSLGEITLDYVDWIKGQEFYTPAISTEATAGFVQLDTYTDFDCTSKFTEGTAINNNTLLHIKYEQLGFYLAGGADQTFSIDTATYLPGDGINKTTGSVVVPNTASASNPYKVKPLEFVADAGEGHPGWSAIYYEMGHEEAPAFVNIDEDGNFAFTVPGTYAFYVNNENKVWFNGGEYAFHARFIEEVGNACNASGNTDLPTLKAVWADMETAFKGLSETEIAAIKAVGFDGGDEHSSDARLVMIAKYHYIVWKYGTSEFKDFIWGATNIPAHANINLADNSLSNNGNSFTIILVTISAISVCSIALLIALKKRKHN